MNAAERDERSELDSIRDEALERAHDCITPDQRVDAFAAVDLYLKAARYVREQRGATR